MLTFILSAIAVILVTIGLVKLIDKFIPTKLKPVLNILLWGLIAFLGYQTWNSVTGPIKFNKIKNKRYEVVISNLMDIRNAQLAYRQVTGRFTDNFDNLVKFVDTAKFTITQRTDKQVIDQLLTERYEVETMKDTVIVDTLGFKSVKDSLFKTSNRYKTMMNVPGVENIKFNLQSGFIEQNDINIPVFEVSVKKDVILHDQEKDLVIQENQIVSVDGVNGDVLKIGSMDEVITVGNWPKTYGVTKK